MWAVNVYIIFSSSSLNLFTYYNLCTNTEMNCLRIIITFISVCNVIDKMAELGEEFAML